uniref:Uncharacterized protein n=1 Tax=Glossina austeni TaxID=7395 RepID=A0A1A9VHH5_GLOAU
MAVYGMHEYMLIMLGLDRTGVSTHLEAKGRIFFIVFKKHSIPNNLNLASGLLQHRAIEIEFDLSMDLCKKATEKIFPSFQHNRGIRATNKKKKTKILTHKVVDY